MNSTAQETQDTLETLSTGVEHTLLTLQVACCRWEPAAFLSANCSSFAFQVTIITIIIIIITIITIIWATFPHSLSKCCSSTQNLVYQECTCIKRVPFQRCEIFWLHHKKVVCIFAQARPIKFWGLPIFRSTVWAINVGTNVFNNHQPLETRSMLSH